MAPEERTPSTTATGGGSEAAFHGGGTGEAAAAACPWWTRSSPGSTGKAFGLSQWHPRSGPPPRQPRGEDLRLLFMGVARAKLPQQLARGGHVRVLEALARPSALASGTRGADPLHDSHGGRI